MPRPSLISRLTTGLAATAAAAMLFTGHAAADPQTVDWTAAAKQLRAVATGNPAAEQAMDRLLSEPERLDAAGEVALPAQPFQIPAQSDIGRGGGAGVYGSGVALGIDGFRFGFFGGPGTIAPNQTGAKLEVIWLNLASGRSGTEVLTEHNDIPVDTTIRSRAVDPGPGMTVAAIYGTLWHRWSVPVSDQHPDGFEYKLGTISFPSLGAVVN
ncbi:hypothetical protein GV794_06280 [Nocardia cyriacigeorgica]|uniref:Uncharacterized protein n=1 Tax=Nocardia cyriacigeorgica TaxID=135487 RepID=A0A6P1D193_9NOCA|nr:hypothetical protein [Nocardia cyriacigeorgica]NEW41000.1 hypothetical protein [Nocardia cyriacigeorgica]NEW44266.1 hypothetical protein [Nocardia cyriacigeorgica]NEW51195.1 hypothetical protein [Nocardia cyriacigeorgica]NEW55266.1 hypothetical protein [Nocardia cyriacigeorgica]